MSTSGSSSTVRIAVSRVPLAGQQTEPSHCSAAPRGRPVQGAGRLLQVGLATHPPTVSRTLSELIPAPRLNARERLLDGLGGPLLGEDHLFGVEEHLHQVIRLHPVLQGQTRLFREGSGPGTPLSQALLAREQESLPPWLLSSSPSQQLPLSGRTAGVLPSQGVKHQDRPRSWHP